MNKILQSHSANQPLSTRIRDTRWGAMRQKRPGKGSKMAQQLRQAKVIQIVGIWLASKMRYRDELKRWKVYIDMPLIWAQFEQTSLGVYFFLLLFSSPWKHLTFPQEQKEAQAEAVAPEVGRIGIRKLTSLHSVESWGCGCKDQLQFSMRIGSWSYSFLKSFEITWFPANSRSESPHVNTWGCLLIVQEEEGKDEAEEEENGRDWCEEEFLRQWTFDAFIFLNLECCRNFSPNKKP